MKSDIEKNLHDLNYNTYLNYLNITLVIIGAFWIAFIFADIPLDFKSVIAIKTAGTFIAIVSAIIIVIVFNDKMKFIKEKIKELIDFKQD